MTKRAKQFATPIATYLATVHAIFHGCVQRDGTLDRSLRGDDSFPLSAAACGQAWGQGS
jgi:hypothetical protein